jgi:hypothetical protein
MELTSVCAVILPNTTASIVPSKVYEYTACTVTKGAIKIVEAKRIRISRLSLLGRSTLQSRYKGQTMRKSVEIMRTKGKIKTDR